MRSENGDLILPDTSMELRMIGNRDGTAVVVQKSGETEVVVFDYGFVTTIKVLDREGKVIQQLTLTDIQFIDIGNILSAHRKSIFKNQEWTHETPLQSDDGSLQQPSETGE